MTNTVSRTVSDETLDCIIQIESSGNPSIKAPTSSALGLGQFLNRTWLGTVSMHRPDVMKNRTEQQVLALRLNPSFSIEMLARFTEANQKIVGRNCSPGDLYLAHFLGAGTAQKLFRADPSIAVEPIVGPAATNANISILRGKTVGQVRAWASSKMARAGGHGWVKKYYRGPVTELDKAVKVESHEEINVQPEKARYNQALFDLQEKLIGLHYYEIGEPDGLWGGKTRGAVTAFLNDRGVQVDGLMDSKGFISEATGNTVEQNVDLAIGEGWSRPIAPKRANATVEEIGKKNEVVKLTLWQRFTSKVGLWVSGLGLGGSSIAGVYDYVTDQVSSFRGMLKGVPPEVWMIIVIVLVGVIYYTSRKTLKAAEEGYNKGSIN